MTQANDSEKPSFTQKELSTYSSTMGMSEEFNNACQVRIIDLGNSIKILLLSINQ
jgi:hypothetical protein